MTKIKQTRVPEPLASILRTHFDVNAFAPDWPASLQRELGRPDSREREQMFRRQLADAIMRRNIKIEEYEKLTGEDFDTEDGLQRWLAEVWKRLYGEMDPRSET
jgi:hypothetical protein